MRRHTLVLVGTVLALLLHAGYVSPAGQNLGEPRAVPRAVSAWATYFGGRGDDRAQGIAVDARGNAYLIGTTSSVDFPAPVPLPPSLFGELPTATYLVKLDPAGAVVYAMALSGNSAFLAADVAVGRDGAAYVLAGQSNLTYVIKVDPSGSRRLYEVTFGGIGRDAVQPSAIAVDGAGQAVIIGRIGFTSISDVFIAKLDAQGRTIYRKAVSGGRSGATSRDVAVDEGGGGNVYITGQTSSDDFPTTSASAQPRFSGGTCVIQLPRQTPRSFPCPDAFLVKLDRRGDLVYSTYFGGTSSDDAVAISVDRTGAAYIAGSTTSADLPTVNALQPTCRTGFVANQCGDGFVAKVRPTGARLEFSTYLGGTSDELITGIAVDPAGSAYIAGSISGNDLPLRRAAQPANGGGPAFVSADDGRSWAPGVGLQAQIVRQFAWTSGARQVVYAASDRGVFLSEDEGRSWHGRQDVPGRDVRGVAVDPRTSGIVYAAVYRGGVFKSVDGGNTWSAMNVGLTTSTLNALTVGAIAVAPSAPSTLYLGTDSGMFRSDNGGMTWRPAGHAFAPRDIVVHPTDPLTVYVAGGGNWLSKTIDGGVSWQRTGPLPTLSPAGVRPPLADHVALDPVDPSMLYVGYNGGVSRSLDGGTSWQTFTGGLPGTASYDVAVDTANRGTVYASPWIGGFRGLYRSTNGSGRWELVDPRFEGIVSAEVGRILVGGTAGADAFVVALDAYGRLLWSTYLGDTAEERTTGIALGHLQPRLGRLDDGRRIVHVIGFTSSPRWALAMRAGRAFGGERDLFWTQVWDPFGR